jgi:exodeoxyribonuclease V beta subunit
VTGEVRYYRRPAALERIEPGRHTVIEASAGTGKTFTLEHLVVDLVLRGVPIENLLVVTFTEKATAELKARVRGKLRQLTEDFPSQAGPEGAWAIDERARARLRAAVSGFERASF